MSVAFSAKLEIRTPHQQSAARSYIVQYSYKSESIEYRWRQAGFNYPNGLYHFWLKYEQRYGTSCLTQ